MPQLVPASESESCLTSIADGGLQPNHIEADCHNGSFDRSFLDDHQPPGEALITKSKEKSSEDFSLGYLDDSLKLSNVSNASDVNSCDNFLNKESWSTCYASHIRGTTSSISSQISIDALVDKLFGDDQRKQFLLMKKKENKMSERKERLKCMGIDPTYRAFMNDERSAESQNVKSIDDKGITQSAIPKKISTESQLFSNRELFKVLESSASSRFSNFFTDLSANSPASVLNEFEHLGGSTCDKESENALSKNCHFETDEVGANLKSSDNNQELLVKTNMDTNTVENFTNDEISNSLEKIFIENTSTENDNAYSLKEDHENVIEYVFDSGNLILPEKADDVQGESIETVIIDDPKDLQTIEVILDQEHLQNDGDLKTFEVYRTFSIETSEERTETIGELTNEEVISEDPSKYVISMESERNETVSESTVHPSLQSSECLYTNTENEVITYVNVPVSEINALSQNLDSNTFQSLNVEYQSGSEIPESVIYSEQNLNERDETITESGTYATQTKRDIISEAYLEAMKGCIEMSEGEMLEECLPEENRLLCVGNNEIGNQEPQVMEISNNYVAGLQSVIDDDNPPKSHPSDEEMEVSSDLENAAGNVPKARKSFPSTPLKTLENYSNSDNLLAPKLDFSGEDASFVKTDVDNERSETSLSSLNNLQSTNSTDSHQEPAKSTARKSFREKLPKSSSGSGASSDESDSMPHKRRKVGDDLDSSVLSNSNFLQSVKTPTTAMKTFVKPFTVAKKSVAEQAAYKTVFQALGVKTAMKTVKPSKSGKEKEGKAIVVSLNDQNGNELSAEEMSPDDSKNTPLCWSPMKELVPHKDICQCSSEKIPCLLNGETLQLICEAEDSIDGQMLPCKKEVKQQYLSRPSSKIKHKAMCDVHLWRLQKHHCCSKCGLFCTQGMFLLCSSSNPNRSGKESHFFHHDCLLVPGVGLPPSCPHCCKFSDFKNVKLVLREKTENEDSSHGIEKSSDAQSVTNGLENYNILMETVNAEPKKPLNGSFTPVSHKQELQSMVMAIASEKSLHLRPAGKCLFTPVRNGDVKKVLQLIVNGVNPNHKFKSHKNNTPLHIGAYYGFTGIVSVLIQYGADIDAVNDDLETPLILAVERNQLSLVRFLVFAGAQVNVKNENGLTAFHVAAKKGSKEIGELLYSTGKFDVNMQDDGGWTPLVWACEKGFTDYIEWLLELGADPNVRDNEENTALHWAACTGDSDILTMFLDRGCNLTFVNQRGDSALHIAARKDHSSCVKLLLKKDVPVDVKNKEGETPLQCCDMGTKSLRILKRHMSNVLRREKVPLLHNVVYRDISHGAEVFPIQAVNEVDGEEFIMDFHYVIRNCYVSSLTVIATVDSMKVCHCTDNCCSYNCACVKLSKGWYDMNGILLFDKDLNDPPSIYECNKTCHCPKTCINRVVQRGLRIPLQIFRTPTMGWGVRTVKELPKGTFVCEYIGEVLDGKEVAEREDDSYLFNLESKSGDVCLDGRFYGNVARFINHSCDPNIMGVRVFIEHQDVNFPRIAFFTLRNVEENEELCFDYGIDFWIAKSQTTLCTCNTSLCKYSKDSIDETLQNYVDQKLSA